MGSYGGEGWGWGRVQNWSPCCPFTLLNIFCFVNRFLFLATRDLGGVRVMSGSRLTITINVTLLNMYIFKHFSKMFPSAFKISGPRVIREPWSKPHQNLSWSDGSRSKFLTRVGLGQFFLLGVGRIGSAIFGLGLEIFPLKIPNFSIIFPSDQKTLFRSDKKVPGSKIFWPLM